MADPGICHAVRMQVCRLPGRKKIQETSGKSCYVVYNEPVLLERTVNTLFLRSDHTLNTIDCYTVFIQKRIKDKRREQKDGR